MNAKLKKTIVVIFTVVFLCSLAGIAFHFVRGYLEDRVDSQVSELVSETPSPTPEPTPPPTPEATAEPTPTPVPQVLEKYAELAAQNPDTIGWLKIEGTAIDNVVMFTPDEPDKYLHIDFYGNYSNRGTLYLDEDCDVWNSDNLIIYGHHMKSSAMFGDLDYYSSQSYWEDHKYIQFDTLYREQTYEVVAAFYTRLLYQNEEGFRYYQFTGGGSEETFNEYVDFINENQCYDTGVDIAYGDKLLTLSTCAYQVENGRFAVVAKLVTDGEASPAPFSADPGGEAAASAALTAAPPADAGTLEISQEETPLAAEPELSRQGFSTNMILLSFCLVFSGTCFLAADAGLRKK